MSHRILKEKLLLYHHICMLPQSSLSNKVLQIQEKFHFPSLKDEVFRFLSEHGVCDVTVYNKKQWRSFVKEKITEANRSFLINGMSKYKKVDHFSLSTESFELKPYFKDLKLSLARVKFRERVNCMTSCRSHFPSDQTNIREVFQCPEELCSKIDTLNHWRECHAYEHLRKGKSLSVETELLEYYKRIIEHRLSNS